MKWNDYKESIKESLDLFEFDSGLLDILKGSINKKQKIFVAGNGGSAAIASHYACDLSKGATNDWSTNFKRYKVICLSSNIGYMTAISNDEHYDSVFQQQLVNLAEPKDIVTLISSSGNSPNIVKAAKWAKENDLYVIGITGFEGGKLKEISDYSAHVPVKSYEISEDIHQIFGHYITLFLKNNGEKNPNMIKL